MTSDPNTPYQPNPDQKDHVNAQQGQAQGQQGSTAEDTDLTEDDVSDVVGTDGTVLEEDGSPDGDTLEDDDLSENIEAEDDPEANDLDRAPREFSVAGR